MNDEPIGVVHDVTHARGVEIKWTGERPKRGTKLYAAALSPPAEEGATPRVDAVVRADLPGTPRASALIALARQLERELSQSWNAAIEGAAKDLENNCATCRGAGFTVEMKCCGVADKNGDCCANGVPEQIQCQDWAHMAAGQVRALLR